MKETRKIIKLSEQAVEVFHRQVDSSGGPDVCWPWTGPRYKDSGFGIGELSGEYGDAGIAGAHIIAFVLHAKRQPRSPALLHSCDNPPCCNPAHLSEGTYKDNHDDSRRKGRSRGFPKGKKKVNLTREIRTAIASEKLPARATARKYGISIGHVRKIKRDHGTQRVVRVKQATTVNAYFPPVGEEE